MVKDYEINKPRTLRCTGAEMEVLQRVLKQIRAHGIDSLKETSIDTTGIVPQDSAPDVSNPETPIKKIDFGISPDEFLKNRNIQPLQTNAPIPVEESEKIYKWIDNSDMLSFERGLNWDGGDIDQSFPEIMNEIAKVVGAGLCMQAAKHQKSNRTLYNDTMEEIYQKWKEHKGA